MFTLVINTLVYPVYMFTPVILYTLYTPIYPVLPMFTLVIHLLYPFVSCLHVYPSNTVYPIL